MSEPNLTPKTIPLKLPISTDHLESLVKEKFKDKGHLRLQLDSEGILTLTVEVTTGKGLCSRKGIRVHLEVLKKMEHPAEFYGLFEAELKKLKAEIKDPTRGTMDNPINYYIPV